jgi:hypothetical protein
MTDAPPSRLLARIALQRQHGVTPMARARAPPQEGPATEVCTICLTEVRHGPRGAATMASLPCGHTSFHRKCLETWLRKNSSCPVCRRKTDAEFICSSCHRPTRLDGSVVDAAAPTRPFLLGGGRRRPPGQPGPRLEAAPPEGAGGTRAIVPSPIRARPRPPPPPPPPPRGHDVAAILRESYRDEALQRLRREREESKEDLRRRGR